MKGVTLMITIKDVTKKFKDHIVLNKISLEIAKGDFVVLIGASGCGKTTTLKLINRLIDPSSGKVYIQGEDIAKKDIIKLRRNMGYVIQQTGLFPHMTIRENIELIPKAEKYQKENIAERTAELMNMVGLEDESFLDRYPSELSGGQQQRIGVARAFATDPDIILMDEPFSALDPITRASLQDELIQLQLDVKKTIVFVTHDMDEAIKLADKICIMDQGEIVQYDTPENILKEPANEFVQNFVGKNRLWSSPEYILAEDIMLDNPATCPKNISIFRCMDKMTTSKIDSLMVIDATKKTMLGIIYAGQIRREPDKSVSVESVMKKDFLFVYREDTILDVLTIIKENNVSYIPVLNQTHQLVGLITRSSLVATLSEPYLEEEDL